MPLHFEDFEPGSRTVSAEDVRRFAELSGDENPLHLDEDHARRAGFAARVAHGALGIALATGLVSRAGVTRGSLIALAGLAWRFRAPVHPGDTLSVVLRVAERAGGGRDDRGTVVFAVTVRNQRGEVVQEGE